MLCKGNYLTVMSGKVGGVVASHNAGGQYIRKLKIPTNPSTSYQQTVRNAMATLATRWGQVLTGAQRAAWATYAANVAWVNRIGDSTHISAINMYINCNLPRIQAGVAVVDAGPGVYALPTMTPPVATIAAAGTTASIAFTNTDAWAGEAGGYMFIYASRPKGPAINFFKGPYRYANKITGAATPPTSPSTPTLPFVIGPAGSKMFFQIRVSRADGRLSSPFRISSTA